MAENTDTGDEALENSTNTELNKASNENIPPVEPDNITPKQETENMETHAHHLHKAPGKGLWHYFFEFLMLFLAVFCGFIAENIREHKIEADQEKQYMKSMLTDLEKDKSDLNSRVKFGPIPVIYNDSLFAELQKRPLQGREKKIYHFLLLYTNQIDISYHDRTISQLSNSGGYRLIHNQNVSDAVLDYDVYMRESMRFIESSWSNNLVNNDVLINYKMYELYKVQHLQDSALAHKTEMNKVAYPDDLKLLSYDDLDIKLVLNSMSYVRPNDEYKYQRALHALTMNRRLDSLIRKEYRPE